MNVSNIQNMFSGNPYSTPVGALVEKVTDPTIDVEDWGLLLDICDNINRSDCGPRDAIRALKKRIASSLGKSNPSLMLVLTCVETCVKNCGFRFHIQVANKDFLHELLKILDTRNSPSQQLVERLLGALQTWSDAFRGEAELREVERTVVELKRKGFDFPMTDLDRMAPIHTPRRSVPDAAVLPKQSNIQHQPAPTSNPAAARMTQQHPAAAMPHPQPLQHQHPQHQHQHPPPAGGPDLSGPITPSTEQVAKLNRDLQVVTGNVRVFNEMLNELSPSCISPEDLSLMQELYRTCRAMQQRIMELLEQLAHEELTSELLRVNDDLNNVFVRYGRFERYRSQQSAADGAEASGPPVTSQSAAEDTSSPPPPSYHQATAATGDGPCLIDLDNDMSTPNTLSSRLANVRVSEEGASAQLSRVPMASAQNAQDEFDAFAQSRSAGTEAQRTAPAGAADGGPPIAAHKEEPFLPGIPDSKEDLDEMEQWVATHDSASVPMTSSEFDQFLAERGGGSGAANPAPPPPPSRRQMKDDEKEGALFAL